jgi:hypothetical protein
MPMAQEDAEISVLYLELAVECLDRAAGTRDPGAAEVLKRMARRYFAHAVALNLMSARQQAGT